jgi:hypothetical protein
MELKSASYLIQPAFPRIGRPTHEEVTAVSMDGCMHAPITILQTESIQGVIPSSTNGQHDGVVTL